MKQTMLCLAAALLLFCVLIFPAVAWANPDRRIVVSMGDSYSSGEGIEPFYGQGMPGCYGDQDWLAHRSEGSWPGRLVVDGVPLSEVRADPSNETVYEDGVIRFSYDDWSDGSWYFVASSGAKTRHVLGRGKDGGNQKKGTMARRDGRIAPGILTYHDASLAPQIEVFDYLDQKYGKGSVEYVTISIGGNDVGFTDIIKGAVKTSGWADPYALFWQIENAKADFKRDVRDDIADVYKEIHVVAGPQAKVIVAGYPILFDGATMGFGISKYEIGLINEAAEWFDEQLASLVYEVSSEFDPDTDWLHYVSVVEAFRKHGAYTVGEYINRIIIPPGVQDIPGTELASAYSIHPNDRGAAAYAAAVQDVVKSAAEEFMQSLEGWWASVGGLSSYTSSGYRSVLYIHDGVVEYFDGNGELQYTEEISSSDLQHLEAGPGSEGGSGWYVYPPAGYFCGDGSPDLLVRVDIDGLNYSGTSSYGRLEGEPDW